MKNEFYRKEMIREVTQLEYTLEHRNFERLDSS